MQETTFKGVMLCARADPPTQDKAKKTTNAFVPGGITHEPIGLNPPKDNHLVSVVAAHKLAATMRINAPPLLKTFMLKHRKWLLEQSRKKKRLLAEIQTAAAAAAASRTKFTASMANMRRRIRASNLKGDGKHLSRSLPSSAINDPEIICASEVAGSSSSQVGQEGNGVTRAEEGLKESQSIYEPKNVATSLTIEETEAEDQRARADEGNIALSRTASASSSQVRAKKSGEGLKEKTKKMPKWALTEEKVEELEEEEAADLVSFAQSLNFEEYVDDVEVVQALSVIRDRVGEQKHKPKDDIEPGDSASNVGEKDDWHAAFVAKWNGSDIEPSEAGDSILSGGSTLRRRTAKPKSAAQDTAPEWDSSSRVDDDMSRVSKTSALEEAKELLEMNPGLKTMHSRRSLAAAIETLSQKSSVVGGDEENSELGGGRVRPSTRNLKETINAGNSFAPRGAVVSVPPLKLVTIHERNTLGKEVDMSNLPHLHRNPAL